MPTLEFVVSKDIKLDPIFRALTVVAGSAHVEAAPDVKFNAPAEVSARVPEVTVEIVKLPAVLDQAEVPLEAKVKTPLELPMLVADIPVALIFAVPVTVSPPVP